MPLRTLRDSVESVTLEKGDIPKKEEFCPNFGLEKLSVTV